MDENDQLFIELQTMQIDKLINNSNFQGAFILLVTTLFKIRNETEKNNLIIYYHDFIFNKYPQLKQS